MTLVNKTIRPRRRRSVELPLHRSIYNFLLWKLPKDAAVHHSPNELDMAGEEAARQVAKATSMGTEKGWPDLEIVWRGRIYFIEVKPEGKGLTGEQPQCHAKLTKAGAPVAICHSIEEAEAALIEWGMRPQKKAA